MNWTVCFIRWVILHAYKIQNIVLCTITPDFLQCAVPVTLLTNNYFLMTLLLLTNTYFLMILLWLSHLITFTFMIFSLCLLLFSLYRLPLTSCLHKNFPGFVRSVILVHPTVFLTLSHQFKLNHFPSKNCSLHLCISKHFSCIWMVFSSTWHNGPLPPPTPLLKPLIFQIPVVSQAIPLLSLLLQCI